MTETQTPELTPTIVDPFEIVHVTNPGIIEGKLPDDLYQNLLSICLDPEVRKNSASNKSVASIKEIANFPLDTEDKSFHKYLGAMFQSWIELHDIPLPEVAINAGVVDCWINYQKKGEFAPIHTHPEAIHFVVWMKIPFENEVETDATSCGKLPNFQLKNSTFELTYNSLGADLMTHTFNLGKEDEGKVIMFPGKIAHQMYPFFTSDEECITICGLMMMFRADQQ